MNKKKLTLIIGGVIIVGVASGIYILVRGGVTPKQRYTSCMRDCYGLVLSESSKQYCPARCTEITKWQPTGVEINAVIADITNTKTSATTNAAVNRAATNVNTNTASNQNSDRAFTTNTGTQTVDPTRQYYCNWVWPQEIIDKETKELVVSCTSDRPWCNYADYSYEKIGCCIDTDYLDCVTLPDLLNNQ